MLNELYTRFDSLCMEMSVYKVETVVGGCWGRPGPGLGLSAEHWGWGWVLES